MNIPLTPEMETRLARLAANLGRPADQVAIEMLTKQLDYDEWFCAEVEKGIKSLDAGDFVTHEEVKRQLAMHLGPDEDSLVP